MLLGEERGRAWIVSLLFAPVLCCILIAGLWPFRAPQNEVTWLANDHAVRLGKRGTILSAGPLAGRNPGSCTVEMRLRPSQSEASGTLLAFYGESGVVGLSLHQSLTDLRLDSNVSRGWPVKRYIGDVFQAGRPLFLTVASGPQGTSVYLDGALARQFPGFLPSPPLCSGSFVVGDSPSADNTWQGELSGLAIYQQDLSAEQGMLNYQSWNRAGRPGTGSGKPDALYLFNENGGNLVCDHGMSGVSLSIPERYVIAQPAFLESPWRLHDGTSDDVKDILVNIGGFVPFGFTLSALLSLRGRSRWIGANTVLAGLLVSLTIEVLQAYLPTRNSDFRDVLTNVLGTWLGMILLRKWLRMSV